MILTQKKIAIVGAGLGGLASSICLAKLGHAVTVFESSNTVGGKASEFVVDGYRFDGGPSLFTLPYLVDELLSGEGSNIEFSYHKEDVACRYFWNDDTCFTAPSDVSAFSKQAAKQFGVQENTIKKYLKNAAWNYEHVGSLFLEKPLNRWKTWVSPKALFAYLNLWRIPILGTLNGTNRSIFEESKLVQLFNRFATYNGSDPYRAPSMLSMIPHLEHGVGTYFPRGGIRSIPKALEKKAKSLGVSFCLDTKVERLHVENHLVSRVEVEGDQRAFDVVVSNMDVVPTYRRLLPDQPAPELLLKQERSSSALIFYWGIRSQFSQLGLHNIFFAENYEAEFKTLFSGEGPFSDPTVYLHISSKCEEQMLLRK